MVFSLLLERLELNVNGNVDFNQFEPNFGLHGKKTKNKQKIENTFLFYIRNHLVLVVKGVICFQTLKL